MTELQATILMQAVMVLLVLATTITNPFSISSVIVYIGSAVWGLQLVHRMWTNRWPT